jgi:hypothetical protein
VFSYFTNLRNTFDSPNASFPTGVHQICFWCNNTGYLSSKTALFGQNQGEVSIFIAQNGVLLYTYPSPPEAARLVPAKQKMLGRPHLAALSGSEGPRQPTSRTLPTAPDGAGKRPQALARLPQRLPQNRRLMDIYARIKRFPSFFKATKVKNTNLTNLY